MTKILSALFVLALCSTALAQPPLESKVKVTKGIASIYRTNVPVTNIITGDPSVADVSPLTDQSILIEGRRIGTTNLIFLNDRKQQLSEVLVVVGEQGAGFTRIHNKAKLNSFTSFSCWETGCEFVGENTVTEPAPLPAGYLNQQVNSTYQQSAPQLPMPGVNR